MTDYGNLDELENRSPNTSNTLKTQLKTLSDDVSLCHGCNCVTHTVDGKCGKCGVDKSESVVSDEVREILVEMLEAYGVDVSDEYWDAPNTEYISRITTVADKRAIEVLNRLDKQSVVIESSYGEVHHCIPLTALKTEAEQLKKGLQQRGKV